MTAPILFRWNGEAMEPLQRFHNIVNEQFVVGQVYRMDAIEERSQASHSHYFASIHDRWMSLPEQYGGRFPTEAHLRKWALIKAGYHDQRTFVCATKAEAQRMAAWVKPIDEFAVVMVREATVTVYTAKSQSVRAMGKHEFQDSKQRVLDVLDEMLGLIPAAA